MIDDGSRCGNEDNIDNERGSDDDVDFDDEAIIYTPEENYLQL